MSFIDGLLFCFDKNKQYGSNLVADLTAEQMVAQPAPAGKAPANHPAWVLSHLNAYLAVIPSVIQGEEFEDPKHHPFGMLSQPENNPSIYASKEELIDAFVCGHEEVAVLLGNASPEILDQPISLPRWAPVFKTVGVALHYIMLNHENMHLGQISAWRRIQGLPSV